MKITRLCFPAILIVLAIFIWPIGVSLLAVAVIVDIGLKRGWHAVDICVAALAAMVFVFMLVVWQ